MAYKLGVLTGILLGIVLIYFILRYTKTDRTVKCKYDERQKQIRANGFTYGFYTCMICNAVFAVAPLMEIHLPADLSVQMFLSILFAAAVQVCYCIWKGAYFSLNEDRKKVLVAFAFIALVNLLLGIFSFYSGKAFTEGRLNLRSLNLFCGLLFLLIFAVLFFRKMTKGEESIIEDEE